MKALLSRAAGGPDALELADLPLPEPAAGQVRVRVRACAVNYPDVLVIEDRYQVRPPRPFAPGLEIAGEVEALGDGVAGWTVGDRVIATLMFGGMATHAVVPAAALHRLPADRDWAEGAALLLTYATAIHALKDRGRLVSGQTLLVLGAAGGVGLAAVELGKAMGARVVAAASTEGKAAAARDAGADETLVYGTDAPDGKALAARLKAACGPDGAHVIFDPVGGAYAEPALRAVAWEGRYLVVGFPAGIPHLPLNLTLLKSCDVCGVFWGAFAARDPAADRANVAELMRLWDAGRIRPRVTGTAPLAEGGRLIARLADRSAVGKLVVLP